MDMFQPKHCADLLPVTPSFLSGIRRADGLFHRDSPSPGGTIRTTRSTSSHRFFFGQLQEKLVNQRSSANISDTVSRSDLGHMHEIHKGEKHPRPHTGVGHPHLDGGTPTSASPQNTSASCGRHLLVAAAGGTAGAACVQHVLRRGPLITILHREEVRSLQIIRYCRRPPRDAQSPSVSSATV